MNVSNLISLAIYMASGSQWSSKKVKFSYQKSKFSYQKSKFSVSIERDLDVFGKWKVTPFAIYLTN